MDNHLVALATALVLACASCGGDARELSRTPAGKAGDAVTGGETTAASLPRVPGALRPARTDDLELTASCPARIGEAEGAHTISLELRNTSGDPISLGSVWTHASVRQDHVLMPGCGDQRPLLVDPEAQVLAPHATMQLSQPMPCAIEEPGSYQVDAVVLVGAPPGARAMESTLRVHRSFTMPLTVGAEISSLD